MDNMYEIAEALRMIVLELQGIREDMKAQSACDVVISDADWYRKANSLGEVL